MAIVFTKNYLYTDLLSTGNSWVIKFSSDSANAPSYAIVSFFGVNFNIDPDPDGNFTFDFYTSISNFVNLNNFNDQQNDVDTSTVSVYNDGTTYKNVITTISIITTGFPNQSHLQRLTN